MSGRGKLWAIAGVGSGLVTTILNTVIVEGPLIATFFVLSAATLVYLLARRPTPRSLLVSAGAIGIGITAALLIWFFVVRVYNVFGVGLGLGTYLWLAAVCVGICLALSNLWDSTRRRKSIAVASVALFLATGVLGINANFGMHRTLGALLEINTAQAITLAHPGSAANGAPVVPLSQTWTPPVGMPATGQTGTQVIPNTISGFASRPAGIYLPPAALVDNPPALPLVVLLMGQPGDPDPQYIAATLDRDAAANNGLAPIVIVADQLGDPARDPLCLDTAKYGNAETFLTQDVVNWARAHLNVIQDPRYWTIAGYSNGGQCAVALAVKHPDLWSNVVDISGEEFAGSENEAATLRDVFGGDQGAYDAQKPINLLASSHLPQDMGVFTVGSNDTGFIQPVQRTADAARAAGMSVTYWESPNGGHVLPALTDGLDEAFRVLYPRLGLAVTH